jgi:predicted ATPase
MSLRSLGTHSLRGLGEPELVYQLVHPDLRSEFPPLRSPARLDNLPLNLTSVIGREWDVERVGDLLGKGHLVTLTGPGGIGKTRLALEVAYRVRDAFADGAWLVELAGLADASLVLQGVAIALGIRELVGRSLAESLALALADKDCLLVLDNCEHVIEACASLAATLMKRCTHLRILATSREALDVAGEQIYPMPMLDLPKVDTNLQLNQALQSPAVRLLAERAGAVRPDFALTQENAAAAAEVCRRLDGIPLAIELAAKRTSVLSIEQIAARLSKSFRVLSRATRDAPGRHQTLAAAIEWSYELLEPREQRLFERLSVFAGNFSLDAVEAVCGGGAIESGDVLDLLQRLSVTSLVEVAWRDGIAWYRLLGAVREYAADRLAQQGETSLISGQHAGYVLQMADARTARPWTFSGFRFDQVDRFEQEYDDVCAALDWFVNEGRSQDALRLATALTWFWSVRGYAGEMLQRVRLLLEATRAEATIDRAVALRATGRLAWDKGDAQLRERLSSEALAIFRTHLDHVGVVLSLQDLGSVATHAGRSREAETLFSESLGMVEAHGLPVGLRPRSLLGLCAVHMSRLEFSAAHADLADAQVAVDSARYRHVTVSQAVRSQVLQMSGLLAFCEEDMAFAARQLDEAAQTELTLLDVRDRATTVALRGRVALAAGDRQAARTYFDESLAVQAEANSSWARILTIEGLAGLVARENPRLAVRAATLALELRSAAGREGSIPDPRYLDAWLDPARRALGQEDSDSASREGRTLTPEAIIAELLEFAKRDLLIGDAPA